MNTNQPSGAQVRWGILGAAQIARKNWMAISHTGNSTVTAVASRDLERGRKFIAECQAEAPMAKTPEAFARYEDLIASPAVDAVYIPLPTGVRKEWVVRAAAAGKHVLCEKPCALSVADLSEMIDVCARNQVQFMDGVMFMHSGRLVRLREVLDDGKSIGKVRRIASAFTLAAPPEFFNDNIRASSQLEPFGCLGDLGWYCIRLALWAMKWQMPRQVSGRILSQIQSSPGQEPVPTEFSGELLFDDGVSSSFYCSFITEVQEWAHISGTRGYLQFPDFVLPFNGDEVGFEVCRNTFSAKESDLGILSVTNRLTVAEHSQNHPTAQATNMFRNFSNQVLSGQLNPTWPDIALKTQQVMGASLDAARA